MKTPAFFEVRDSFKPKGHWYLGTPVDVHGNELDPRSFTEGKHIEISENIFVPITAGSTPLDFTLGSFDMPIVSRRIAERLQKLEPKAIQRIPVTIDSERMGYEILNVTVDLACLDEARSEITWWKPKDGRPDRLGTYQGIGKKVLKMSIVDGYKIFRIKGWLITLVVAREIKEVCEHMNVSGVTFKPLQAM